MHSTTTTTPSIAEALRLSAATADMSSVDTAVDAYGLDAVYIVLETLDLEAVNFTGAKLVRRHVDEAECIQCPFYNNYDPDEYCRYQGDSTDC